MPNLLLVYGRDLANGIKFSTKINVQILLSPMHNLSNHHSTIEIAQLHKFRMSQQCGKGNFRLLKKKRYNTIPSIKKHTTPYLRFKKANLIRLARILDTQLVDCCTAIQLNIFIHKTTAAALPTSLRPVANRR